MNYRKKSINEYISCKKIDELKLFEYFSSCMWHFTDDLNNYLESVHRIEKRALIRSIKEKYLCTDTTNHIIKYLGNNRDVKLTTKERNTIQRLHTNKKR